MSSEKDLSPARGRYWVRTSDLFGVNEGSPADQSNGHALDQQEQSARVGSRRTETGDSDAPLTHGNDLAALYRDALAAIREALDIPHAATIGWDEKRQEILDRRLSHAVVALEGVLGADPDATIGGISLIAWRVAYLREKLSELPADGYITNDEAHAALKHGASWFEAVAEPREHVICGPGCCAPILAVHLGAARPEGSNFRLPPSQPQVAPAATSAETANV